MTGVIMECNVPQYDETMRRYRGSIRLHYHLPTLDHPTAVSLTDDNGKEMARVPLDNLFKAIKWLHDCAPR